MVRKTISIDEHLFLELEKEGILENFKNFSDLVSSSLRTTIKRIRKENYKKEIAQMANDPLVQNDIDEIEDDFKYADGELNCRVGFSRPLISYVLFSIYLIQLVG